MSRIYVISGSPGIGKSTCAGSGQLQEGQRHFYAETDPGSFNRANFPNPEVFDLHHYFPPLETLFEFGSVNIGEKGGVAPFNSRRISGMTELMEQFVADLLIALRDPAIADIIYDTSSALWQHVTAGFQQEVQDAKSNEEAKRLDTLHYTEPNRRMRSYLQAPAMMGKDLMLIEHEREVYIGDKPTGTFKPDGFKEVPGMADASVRLFLVNKKPVGRITKAGAGGLELVDLEIVEPTIPKLNKLLNAAELIRNFQQRGLDQEMPGDYDSIVQLAEGLSK